MKRIEINGNIYEYDEKENRSILDFLESKDVKLKSGCRDGYCGDCRCKILSGNVEVSDNAIGFHNEDEILTCVSRPETDIKIKNIN